MSNAFQQHTDDEGAIVALAVADLADANISPAATAAWDAEVSARRDDAAADVPAEVQEFGEVIAVVGSFG